MQQELDLKMVRARISVILLGMLLPYGARLPRGAEWLSQYTDGGWDGFLIIQGFNALAWGSIILVSFVYRRAIALLPPCLLAFGFLFWVHFTLDLASDANAAIALIFIPVYAIPLAAIGGLIGYFLEWKLRREQDQTLNVAE